MHIPLIRRCSPRRLPGPGRLAPAASLAAASALLLSACVTAGAADTGGETSASGTLPELSGDEQIEIVFESYNLNGGGMWDDAITGLIEEFEAEHPHISVTGQGVEVANIVSSAQQQLLAGSPPDVGQFGFGQLDFAQSGLQAANLTELVGEEALAEHFGGEYPFHERARVLADIDGRTTGMPYVFSTPVLWINETVLEEAGIDPAAADYSTWDSVAALAEQVSEETGEPALNVPCVVTGGSWCMQGLFFSNGADVISEDRSEIEFGSPEAVETVEVFQDMYKAGVLSNEDEMSQYDTFGRGGTAAFQLTTSALQSTFMQGAEAGGWTLGTDHMPQFGEQETAPTNSGSALVILAQEPEKQAAAWEFMQFMTSPRAYEVITTEIGYLPLRSTMTEAGGPLHSWVEENPLVTPNLEQLDRLVPAKAYPGEQFQEVDRLLDTAIQDAVFQGEDAGTTLPEAAERSQALIEE
ncbi:extracellular solute-binding protein [Brevibacterium album]|uniref:extracellular solute-binding protein n=1 Tax=Brevibacterium album TaxID=417948 RepID=UPI00040D6F1B|nr:extracellular solute-binding protein [Brevibacterium album]